MRTVLARSALAALMLLQAAWANERSGDVIPESLVRAHMEFLASDAMNGRGSGSRDEWITATYIAAQMRRAGLAPLGDAGDYVQTVDISRTLVTGTPLVKFGSVVVPREQLFFMSMQAASVQGVLQQYRAGTPIRAGAVLLMPETQSPDDDLDLDGATLVLWHDTDVLRALWPVLARREIRVGPSRLAGVAPSKPATGPSQIVLDPSAYAAAMALPQGSSVSVAAQTTESKSHTWNAVARLEGAAVREKDQIILLSAHLDHLGTRDTGVDRIYNGADDDASGSIAVLTYGPKRWHAAHGPNGASYSPGSAARRPAATAPAISCKNRWCLCSRSWPISSSK